MEGGKTWMEFYYKIPYNELTFIKKEELFEAQLRTEVDVTSTSGDTIVRDKWDSRSTIRSYEEAKRGDAFLLNQFEIPLDPGDYLFNFSLTDLNSKNRGFLKRVLHIPSYAKTEVLSLSDIEFSNSISSDTTSSVFNKNGIKILPNPTRIYGGKAPLLYTYCEIYNLSQEAQGKPSNYSVEYSLMDSVGNLIKKLPIKENQKPGKTTVEVGGVNLVTFKPGKYILQIKVFDHLNKAIAIREGPFFIEKPQAMAQVLELKDEQEYYDKIEYFATSEELKIYKSLEPEGKKRFLENFWKKKDPNPNTGENEFLQEFGRRYLYANQRFSSGFKKGSETDRGRIYIKYGPPDEIEPHPADLTYRAHEIWFYYGKGGKKFIFVDTTGFGKYDLLYSSIKDEPTDPNWSKWINPTAVEQER